MTICIVTATPSCQLTIYSSKVTIIPSTQKNVTMFLLYLHAFLYMMYSSKSLQKIQKRRHVYAIKNVYCIIYCNTRKAMITYWCIRRELPSHQWHWFGFIILKNTYADWWFAEWWPNATSRKFLTRVNRCRTQNSQCKCCKASIVIGWSLDLVETLSVSMVTARSDTRHSVARRLNKLRSKSWLLQLTLAGRTWQKAIEASSLIMTCAKVDETIHRWVNGHSNQFCCNKFPLTDHEKRS